jgi:drug/metabolite transporter (DMT)-like permease
MQVAPIMVVLGGAIFLKEQVGWRRWAAVLAGMIGMLIVIRPGGEGFSYYSIFAVVGVSGLAGRDLVTRLAPAEVPAVALSTWGFMSTIPIGLGLFLFQGAAFESAPVALWPIFGAVIVTTTGYFAVTMAMRMAPVSIVSPFRYTRLIFTTALGLIFLDETLDNPTLVGAAIILVAGIYTFWRERKLALEATGEA